MTKICLVRHGETDWNLHERLQGATDVPLNERGHAQARTVAAYLAREPWDYLYASPLGRAYDTASIIAKETGISDIRTDDRLKERSFGALEGLELSVYREHYQDLPVVEGRETWEEVQKRGMEAVEEMVQSHPDRRILVVAHGGLISSILRVISDGELGPKRPKLKNASMNLLIHNGSWHIEWYNRVTPELEAVSRLD